MCIYHSINVQYIYRIKYITDHILLYMARLVSVVYIMQH